MNGYASGEIRFSRSNQSCLSFASDAFTISGVTREKYSSTCSAEYFNKGNMIL